MYPYGRRSHLATQLREIELRVQREINEKRQELLAKEESLRRVRLMGWRKPETDVVIFRNLESRLAAQGSQSEFRD